MRFNPGFFYGKDRKHSVNERQVKRALDKRLAPRSIFPVLEAVT